MIVFKRIIIIVGIICLILLVFYANHRIQLSREHDLLKPLGQLVAVDGKKMSIYTEGKENTRTALYLDCAHYIHDYEYSRISDDIKQFLE